MRLLGALTIFMWLLWLMLVDKGPRQPGVRPLQLWLERGPGLEHLWGQLVPHNPAKFEVNCHLPFANLMAG